VSIRYKYSHEKEWTQSNEVLEVELSVEGYYVWLNDWDEGQQDIEILGCVPISEINVPQFERNEMFYPQVDGITPSVIITEDRDTEVLDSWQAHKDNTTSAVETMSCQECKHWEEDCYTPSANECKGYEPKESE
jgi:hypothetical protein